MTTPPRPRAVLYTRVSTDGQERDETSLSTQSEACERYARDSGWTVVETISDTASGATLDRPGLERVRGLLRDGAVDVVLAYAVDRLSRNQNQIGVIFDEVEQAGARLAFVTEAFEDTAVGRFILGARAFVAEVERERIAKRTQDGKAARSLRQAPPGGRQGHLWVSLRPQKWQTHARAVAGVGRAPHLRAVRGRR